MQKSFFLFTFLLILESAMAQRTQLQKVTFGVVVPVSGTMTLTTPLKPFVLGYNLLPNIVFVTNKTYHNFLYGMGNNVLRTIQGYKPRKDLGVYLALQKNLSSESKYVGIGIEKFIPVTPTVTFFLFSEIGMNSRPGVNSKVFILGTHLNIQSFVWKK